jgi:transposase
MFIVVKKKSENRWQVQVVESVRQGKKVCQKIVRNIGAACTTQEIEDFKKIGEAAIVSIMNARQPVLAFVDPAEFYAPRKRAKSASEDQVRIKNLREEKRINEGIPDIFGKLYEDLGFDKIITDSNKDEEWNAILQAAVLGRISLPDSKLATSRLLSEDFDIKIPVQKIYRMLDLLGNKEEEIKKLVGQKTTALFQESVDVLFFDVTTLYFESIVRDELKEFGFSKDCKFNQSQVTLALVTTKEGLPITYKLFPGNTYEGHTLLAMATELKRDYRVDEMVLVADRAMFTKDNLKLMDKLGMKYIVAAKLKTLPAKKKEEILSSDFKLTCMSEELHWVQEFEHESRRLVVGYSTDRAKKDASDRARLIARLEKKTKNSQINVNDVINNAGTKKFLKLPSAKAFIDQEKIEKDQQWDGLHGIITNMREASAQSLLERYRGLWQIEEAFRVNKHSLKMRPIYHWTPRRIQAHVSLCYLAFAVVKHSLHLLKNKGVAFSFEEIRHQLKRVQASTVIDLPTKNRYVIPSALNLEQKIIYQAFGLQRDLTPYKI